jgi:ankyrin repeat protein
MLASYHGYTGSVNALLACSTVIDNTALQLAVMRRHVETVTALLRCPSVVATANVVNNNGFTALMIAEQTGHACMYSAVVASMQCAPTLMIASKLEQAHRSKPDHD